MFLVHSFQVQELQIQPLLLRKKMKKKPRVPKPKPFLAALSASSGPGLIRHLGSCNASVRFQSLKLIQAWLSTSEAQLSEDDMKRLWKGLFYCIWHSDKAPAQSLLINRLSSLLLTLDPLLSLQYFTTFLLTLRREWNGIDHLRLDKFYLLIRRFVNGMFCLMRKYKWDLEYLEKYVVVLENEALIADDKLLGNGVNYHIASVFLQEIRGFNVPLERKEVVDCLFRPFFNVLQKSLDKILIGKVKSYVFDELLNMGKELLKKKIAGTDVDKSQMGEVLLGTIALKLGFSDRLYGVGSAPDCVQGNRKVVLGLNEEFLKLEKELGASGIEIGFPEFTEIDDDNGEEVPELIPIDNGESGAAVLTEDAKLKKKKKKKAKKDSQKMDKNTTVGSEIAGNNLEENGDSCIANSSENGNVEADNAVIIGKAATSGTDVFDFNETVMSNLQLQFEKVAAELDYNGEESEGLPTPLVTTKKKRKKGISTDKPSKSEADPQGEDETGADKSSKKVRFSMKSNLVWKPHSPLPPQSLRLPPSVTPRGSALKKGVPPGPIREMLPAKKKLKQKKKGRKILMSVSPAVKRLKKVRTQVLSA